MVRKRLLCSSALVGLDLRVEAGGGASQFDLRVVQHQAQGGFNEICIGMFIGLLLLLILP